MIGSFLPSWLDRTLSAWLAFWLSLVVVYNHAGALAWAGLVVILGAAGVVALVPRLVSDRGYIRPAIPFLVTLTVLFAWMMASAGWGEYGPDTAWRLATQALIGVGVPVLLVSRSERLKRNLSHVLMATALAGVAVILADAASGYGLSLALDPVGAGEDLNYRQGEAEMHLGRGQVAWALLSPLLLALMAKRLPKGAAWVAGVALVGLLVAGCVLNRLYTPVIILLGALPLFALGWAAPKLALRLSGATAVLSIALAPLVGLVARTASEGFMARLPMSWDHRLRMWDYTLQRVAERPLLGHGLDASRAMQDGFTTRIGVDIPYISLHPHNVGLQAWLELGAIGALLMAAALGLGIALAGRLANGSRARLAALSGLFMGMSVGGAVTVGAWQYWWWGLIVMAALLVVFIPAKGTDEVLELDAAA